MVVREGLRVEGKATALEEPHCASPWAYRPNAAAAAAEVAKMAASASPGAVEVEAAGRAAAVVWAVVATSTT